ncbi:MAG: hypothetical protein M1819_002529 [Sarea resinae]|nr:MAG: hypothetical protein M1819_002529 [Sarea resinae]
MRLPSLLGPRAAHFFTTISFWSALVILTVPATAASPDSIPSPNLDLSQLGRVALVGDFDAISFFTYEEQNENSFSTNGSQSLLTRLPNGAFTTLAASDASINTMCPFVLHDGTFSGIIVGGNFTDLGGIEAQGVALFDPNTTKITPLPGLSGKVSAVLCDQNSSTVYVGGDFRGGNSTNAIAWVGTSGWTNLPFAGFNGPVTSIVKAPDGNVVFGGAFDGLGNATGPKRKDQQIINISSANISAAASTTTTGFSDPSNIVCKTGGQDGSGSTWLLQDDAPGFWRADFGFGFQPTKLRIWNTRQDGRGTKTFRFTALPINGIMNLTYTDSTTGKNATCDANCPLPQQTTSGYQDFEFINVIGMSAFRIDISDWYGNGGGLDGIELFQDDIYAFAVGSYNEPSCANIQYASNSTSTGPWSVAPSAQSASGYLTANLTDVNANSNNLSVVFEPDIKQSGNYSVTMWTPGCFQDKSCSSRGIVNVTGVMASGTRASAPIQTEVYQTNNYDKYDQIYYGYVDANSDSFRPTVTLTPSAGQSNNLTIVAQRVRFELIDSTGGLNGLYEFNPNEATVNTDFAHSAIDQAGMDLNTGAVVSALAVGDGVTYVGGNFSTSDFQNFFAVSKDSSTNVTGGGLNGPVLSMFLNGSLLYVGGDFTNTSKTKASGLSYVASYSISDQSWQPLGAGVNGRVISIVPLILNVTTNTPEMVIAMNGDFDQVLAFGNNQSATASGLAIWVPSQKNWLQNLNTDSVAISGKFTATTNVPNSSPLFAGAVSSQDLSANDAVALTSSQSLGMTPFPLHITPQQVSKSSQRKRAVSGQNVTGAVTGLFFESGDLNVTVIGGHFTAEASNGTAINNLAFINGSNSDQISGVDGGLDSDAVFLALETQGNVLYAGGTFSGTVNGASVNGLISYDLGLGNYVAVQPPALGGDDVAVNAIATQPGTGNVFVGGNFDTAGSLGCPSVCVFTTAEGQWNRPGANLAGSVAALTWSSDQTIVASGNLSVNNVATSVATYSTKHLTWSAFDGAGSLPGPVTALTAANDDGTEFWVAGKDTNGLAFLTKYNGSGWDSVGSSLGKATVIRGLQVLSLSKNHAQSNLVDESQTLLITGQLELPNFGNASAALFNGTTFTPFILSNTADNGPGSLSQIFSQKQNFFKSDHGHMAVGFVVLIALAIALALVFILVVIGILAERVRRKREGYMPAPTQMFDKSSNMGRIPPEHLFGSLGHQPRGPGDAPMI